MIPTALMWLLAADGYFVWGVGKSGECAVMLYLDKGSGLVEPHKLSGPI